MRKTPRGIAAIMLVLLSIGTTGCDRIVNTSRSAQAVTKHAFEDTKSSWRDFFTYHPTMPDPLPQTRYCYQMQSDVVCYDSEQTQLTSKLVGYQDGENIAWIQPGGGSLGASGGGAVALRPVPKQEAAHTKTGFTPYAVVDVDTSPQPVSSMYSSDGTVASTKGQISVNSLPPTTPVKKN